MKKIIINGKFLSQKVTGVQRYARELVEALDNIAGDNTDFEIAVPPEAKDIPKYKNIKVNVVGKLHKQMWEQISFPKYVKSRSAVSLNLCNAAPLSNPGIVCIHDVKIKAYPQFFKRSFLMWYGILFSSETKKAKHIITVSDFSKSEICRYYNVNSDRITVIPNAWQHFNRIDYNENTLTKYGLVKQEYYFGMSSLESNKNFKWIAEAAIANPGEIFAVAGSINEKIFSKGLGFNVPKNMKLLGYVSDEEAKTLMRDCKAFLFPSFYEGFGIPPLEAAAAGAKQVIISDIPVMHELFEDNALYIDPDKYESLPDAQKTVNNEIVLGKYSWQSSAEKLLDLLKKI